MDNIYLLYRAILMERRIIIYSSCIWILNFIIDGLLKLMYPFEWMHVLISVLPDQLEDYLNAPFPYIIGINKKENNSTI